MDSFTTPAVSSLADVETGIPSDMMLPFNISTITAALSTLTAGKTGPIWPNSCQISDGQFFDIIIVGAGTAGCVLANRLSEVKDLKVAVIEAGGDPPLTSVVPGLFFLLPGSPQDWKYYSEDDGFSGRAQKGHRYQLTSGKMLGGTSSLNHLVWARGNKPDFENWNSSLWTWDVALKYFKKAESMRDPTILNSDYSRYHGSTGPITLSGHADKLGFGAEETILNALKDIGVDKLVSTNGPDNIGASRIQYTVDDKKGARQSTAATYLLQAKGRSNLCIVKDTLVTKILIGEDMKAAGVQLSIKSGDTLVLFANLEVIVSAGALNTPKLLMLSGVGPKSELDKFEIDIKADLPVGKNLQDHVFSLIFITGRFSPASTLANVVAILNSLTFPVPSVQGFFTVENQVTNNPATIQDFLAYFGALSPLLFIVCTVVFNFNVELCGKAVLDTATREVVSGLVNLEHPLSRGSVTLRSTDANDPPVVQMGYFTEKEDIETLAKGLEEAARLTQAPYFKDANSEILKMPLPECDDFEFQSHDYWKCYAVKAATTNFHYISTCKMGSEGVVTERLTVHGIDKLRVVDASVIPSEVSGETYAATVMTAERAADLIKEDYGYSEK